MSTLRKVMNYTLYLQQYFNGLYLRLSMRDMC